MSQKTEGDNKDKYEVAEGSPGEEFLDQFDYVMVFPLKEKKRKKDKGCCGGEEKEEEFVERKQTDDCKKSIRSLLQRGLELYIYKSVQEDELYVLISVPDETVVNFADKINYEMLLDKTAMFEKLKAGNELKRIAPIEFPPMDTTITNIEPFSYIYGRFKKVLDPALYAKDKNGNIFDPSTRLKLCHYIITGPVRDGGCDISTMKLLHSGDMLAYFPVHDKAQLKALSAKCVAWTTMPWKQPFEEIKQYFGEKFGLYNAFLGHYTLYLIIPAVIGFAFQVIVWDKNNFSHPVLPFFGIVICLWCIIMLEFWKGKESRLALEWGMVGFEDEEPDRPDFVGKSSASQIDGKLTAYFPSKQAAVRRNVSYSIIGLFILIVISTVGGIYVMKYVLQAEIGSFASTVASVVNTVQITIFNMTYQYLVTKLTNLENHRTDTLYQDSLITKLFMFQFVNSYASFFYLAFVASWVPSNPNQLNPDFKGQCGWYDCMQPLSINLAIIFGSRLVVTNTLDILIPALTKKLNVDSQSVNRADKGKRYEVTVPEYEFTRMPFDPIYDSIKNYSDSVIQFGFMSLFITALPIACFFDMLNSYVKLRIQAFNMKNYYQRPIPVGAEDIGSWQSIFTFMSVLAVITNGAIICFTMDHSTWTTSVTPVNPMTDGEGSSYSASWIFICFQWCLIGLQFVLIVAIPDVPEKVTIQIKRMKFIVSKLIDFQEDLDYFADPTGKGVPSNDFEDLGFCGCTKQVRLKKGNSAASAAVSTNASTTISISIKEAFPFYKANDFPKTNAFPELLTATNISVLKEKMHSDKPFDDRAGITTTAQVVVE